MKTREQNRRSFMGFAGAGLAGIAAGPWAGPAAAGAATTGAPGVDVQDADLVVFNARVFTVDVAAPRAEAFAVKGGRFLAVGTTADIKALAGKSTQTYDAKGMTIVPGFTDCHNHAPGTRCSTT